MIKYIGPLHFQSWSFHPLSRSKGCLHHACRNSNVANRQFIVGSNLEADRYLLYCPVTCKVYVSAYTAQVRSLHNSSGIFWKPRGGSLCCIYLTFRIGRGSEFSDTLGEFPNIPKQCFCSSSYLHSLVCAALLNVCLCHTFVMYLPFGILIQENKLMYLAALLLKGINFTQRGWRAKSNWG